MHCVTQPSSVSSSLALSLLLHYGALLKFLSGLNSHLLFLVCSRWDSRSSLSLSLSMLGRLFLRFRLSFPFQGTNSSIIPGLLEKGSISLVYVPADVQFALSCHELQCRLLLSRKYSLGNFKYKCVEIVLSEEAWTSDIGYQLIKCSAT